MITDVNLSAMLIVCVALRVHVFAPSQPLSTQGWAQLGASQQAGCVCADDAIIRLPSQRVVLVHSIPSVNHTSKRLNITYENKRMAVYDHVHATVKSPGRGVEMVSFTGHDAACIQICTDLT